MSFGDARSIFDETIINLVESSPYVCHSYWVQSSVQLVLSSVQLVLWPWVRYRGGAKGQTLYAPPSNVKDYLTQCSVCTCNGCRKYVIEAIISDRVPNNVIEQWQGLINGY